MPPIDYEKEYDNRGRVPEHPEIFARWEAGDQGLSRGIARRQTGHSLRRARAGSTIDLFPAKDDDAMTPLAMFIHGGWWRSLDPAMFSQMAKGAECTRRHRRGRRL